MNHCGTCKLCCRVMGVKEPSIEFDKPSGEWCEHCDKSKGCTIYEGRPLSCRVFECLWLASQSINKIKMPPQYRPDKTHVVLHIDTDPETKVETLAVHVDRKHPNAWKDQPIAGFLVWYIKRKCRVVVVIGDLVYAFNVPGHEATDHKAVFELPEQSVLEAGGEVRSGELPFRLRETPFG